MTVEHFDFDSATNLCVGSLEKEQTILQYNKRFRAAVHWWAVEHHLLGHRDSGTVNSKIFFVVIFISKWAQ